MPTQPADSSAPNQAPPRAALPAEVEIRRSARRRRTVSAYREQDRTVVLVPARMSRAEEARWVAVMLEKLDKQESRRAARAAGTDAELQRRALTLAKRWLDGACAPVSVRWVGDQRTRWGSCTPSDGTIRLSDRMRTMPDWVVDYVLVHELTHLLVAGHGPDFHALVDRYPKAERARGYLEGVLAGARSAALMGDQVAGDVPGDRRPGDVRPDDVDLCG